MRIARATVVPFTIRFRRPLVTGAGTIDVRTGSILELVDAAGRIGRGEASPAYWVGDESLAAVAAVLHEAATLVGRRCADLAAVVETWRPRSPAAACALDTARLDLAARGAGVPLAVQICAGDASAGALPDRVPVAALLIADDLDGLAAEVRAAVREGYRTVKLKVGGRPPAEDVARVAAVRAAGGSSMRIRLDANRAWTVAEASACLAAMARFAPDFVEEPLGISDPDAWEDLRTCGVALARDESIAGDVDYERLAGSAEVLVVKAPRLGGPTATLALGRRARADGRRVVVTDAIETAIGCAVATHLAAVLHRPGDAVGLGGARLLDPTIGHVAPARAFSRVGSPGLGEQEHGALAS